MSGRKKCMVLLSRNRADKIFAKREQYYIWQDALWMPKGMFHFFGYIIFRWSS